MRTPRALKARVAVVALAATLGGASYAAAATLGVVGNPLGAGKVSVPACDTDGFNYTRVLDASHNVTSVTVSGVNAACNGGTLQLVLGGTGGAALGSGSTVISTTSVTVPITGTAPASSLIAYYVGITN